MPLYDRKCEKCGNVTLDHLESINAPDPNCHLCVGAVSPRVWISKAAAVAPDDIPGGLDVEHAVCHDDGTPRRFYSRSELKRALAEKGWAIHDDHVTARDTDKNPHTSRWAGASAHSLTFDDPEVQERRKREMADWLGITVEKLDEIQSARGAIYHPDDPVLGAIWKAVSEYNLVHSESE